jgi:23S rRNA G2445 N2-methylase RlmL
VADPNVYDLAALKKAARAALVRLSEAWQEELKKVRVVDPACGSGAFLIEALDQLHAAFDAANGLEELRGHKQRFNLNEPSYE